MLCACRHRSQESTVSSRQAKAYRHIKATKLKAFSNASQMFPNQRLMQKLKRFFMIDLVQGLGLTLEIQHRRAVRQGRCRW